MLLSAVFTMLVFLVVDLAYFVVDSADQVSDGRCAQVTRGDAER